jgi:hypothetical protein
MPEILYAGSLGWRTSFMDYGAVAQCHFTWYGYQPSTVLATILVDKIMIQGNLRHLAGLMAPDA